MSLKVKFQYLAIFSAFMTLIGFTKINTPHLIGMRISEFGFVSTISSKYDNHLMKEDQKHNPTNLGLNNSKHHRFHHLSRSSQTSQTSFTQPMVLSLDYWEQTGNALSNLFALQCWARTLNITKVVEPYIYPGEQKVFHYSVKSNETITRFQDIFNISHWNKISLMRNNSILVSNKDFLQFSLKEIIHVQLRFKIYSPKCKSYKDLKSYDWFKFLESNGFNISTVCIERLEFPVAEDVFQNKIFGSSRGNATILFDIWRGLSNQTFRLTLQGSRCVKKTPFGPYLTFKPTPEIKYLPYSLAPLLPSQLVLSYIHTFVADYMRGTPYVAVMLRSERMDQSISSSPLKFSHCMEGIISDHRAALDHMNGNKTLLFTDSGSHGSLSLWWKAIASNFSQYLEDNLNLEMSPTELDAALEDITSSKDSVLMAIIQSHLVARATCVVVIGGGTFQRLTLNMYAIYHKGQECYFHRNSLCTPMYIDTTL